MQDWRIRVIGLKDHQKGSNKGFWFTFPFELSEIYDLIDIKEAKNYLIIDYDLPFNISTTERVGRLMDAYREWEKLPTLLQDVAETLLKEYYTPFIEGFEELTDDVNNGVQFVQLTESNDFVALGKSLLKDVSIPDSIKSYIDYEAYAKDQIPERIFVPTYQGFIEIIK